MDKSVRNKLTTCFVRIISLILVVSFAVSLCSCSVDNSDFNGMRFGKTRHITVQVDSYLDDNAVNSSVYAQYIHDAVLRDCNIDVRFVNSEDHDIAKGSAADITTTTNFSYINTNFKMNTVTNIAPYLKAYSDSLTDLTDLLGEDNVYSCTTDRSEVWYLTCKAAEPVGMVTFIRADWLDKLGLEAPTTTEEFHNCLVSFRDNADLLLGEEADKLIPFFIDNEPNLSAKPLFDSYLDTSISDKDYYVNGYKRVTQQGFSTGLKTLNSWYLEDLLPEDFTDIRPLTKESYLPIESGYVGAFCADYDYLYKNGEDSHFASLKANCGDSASYIAVNAFPNKDGEYTYWHEDYLFKDGLKIYIPTTCNDPLACLVYLNWISNADNIKAIQSLSSDGDFTSDMYLITIDGMYSDAVCPEEQQALETALQITEIKRGCKCVAYGPLVFGQFDTEVDVTSLYPDSTSKFVCGVITSPEGELESNFNTLYDEYIDSGTYYILFIRNYEWNKVMVEGDMLPW